MKIREIFDKLTFENLMNFELKYKYIGFVLLLIIAIGTINTVAAHEYTFVFHENDTMIIYTESINGVPIKEEMTLHRHEGSRYLRDFLSRSEKSFAYTNMVKTLIDNDSVKLTVNIPQNSLTGRFCWVQHLVFNKFTVCNIEYDDWSWIKSQPNLFFGDDSMI